MNTPWRIVPLFAGALMLAACRSTPKPARAVLSVTDQEFAGASGPGRSGNAGSVRKVMRQARPASADRHAPEPGNSSAVEAASSAAESNAVCRACQDESVQAGTNQTVTLPTASVPPGATSPAEGRARPPGAPLPTGVGARPPGAPPASEVGTKPLAAPSLPVATAATPFSRKVGAPGDGALPRSVSASQRVAVRTQVHLLASTPAPAREQLIARLRLTPNAPCAVMVPGQKQPVLLTCDQALKQLADVATPLRAILLPVEGEDLTNWAQAVTTFETVAAVEKLLGDTGNETRWRQEQLTRQATAQQAAQQQREAVHGALERWLAPRR